MPKIVSGVTHAMVLKGGRVERAGPVADAEEARSILKRLGT